MSNPKYEEDPVFYCFKCLSLRTMMLDEDIDYCDDCGSTDIRQASVEEWESMYIERYGKKYIDKDGRESKKRD